VASQVGRVERTPLNWHSISTNIWYYQYKNGWNDKSDGEKVFPDPLDPANGPHLDEDKSQAEEGSVDSRRIDAEREDWKLKNNNNFFLLRQF